MRKKKFYVITIVMVLMVLTTLTGCGKKKENEADIQQEENKPEVSLINEDKNIVYTVKEKSGYKIPKINLTYDNVKVLNKELLAYGEQRIEEMTNDGKIAEGGVLSYKYYENDNIISIVYEYESPITENSDKYKVWNIDKYTGEVITNDQILNKKAINLEEFKELYKEKIGLYFEEVYKETKDSVEETLYKEQYEKTIADENIDINNLMYLNENNEICMVSKVHSLTEADYYEHIIVVKK